MNLKLIPAQDRPRERLARYGADPLSSVELLAILLGSGTQQCSVLHLAEELLAHFGGLRQLCEASLNELKQIKGIGLAKAVQLQAAFALFKRLGQEFSERLLLRSPQAVYEAVRQELEDQKIEVLLILLRDVKRYLIHREVLSRGTLNELLIHPREVFHAAIRHRAHSAIIAHNHPSGDPQPSSQDLDMTRILAQAGCIVGIELTDHLIIGRNGFVSFYQKGFFKRDTY
ncbi:MAG: DNA repair protein RadC [Chlamydiia bacterium]|nr:DNA repair protein RadC [Chlamydiia bacterium]